MSKYKIHKVTDDKQQIEILKKFKGSIIELDLGDLKVESVYKTITYNEKIKMMIGVIKRVVVGIEDRFVDIYTHDKTYTLEMIEEE